MTHEEALDAAEAGLREADGSVVVAFSGGETVEQATALARIVREGLGSDTALLPDDWEGGLAAFRAPLSAIQDADVCLVLGDDPVIERAPVVDLWLRAARRRGAEVITLNPAGDVQVAPGSAPQVCAALRSGAKVTAELKETAERVRGAARIALVWSEDDPTGGRHVGALASDLAETAGAHVAVYTLPRTPNGRGVAQAWYALGEGRADPPAEGDIGALIVSGDEAGSDPRVAELAARARFVLTTAMFQSDLTAWSHVVVPGTSYLEREGTFVNLEGRPQRLRRAVVPDGPDELEWLARLAERFGVAVDPWACAHGRGAGRAAAQRRVCVDAARPAGGDRQGRRSGARARPLRHALQRRRGRARAAAPVPAPPGGGRARLRRRRDARDRPGGDRAGQLQRDDERAAGTPEPQAPRRRRAGRGRARRGTGRPRSGGEAWCLSS